MNIIININTQTLQLLENEYEVSRYCVSTATNGPGEQKNSEKTPRGKHMIRAKIGGGLPINTIFIRRRPTGEIYQRGMKAQYPHRDWILTRLLWLSGLEIGKNRLGNVDTMQRYIYIHGTPDEVTLGEPSSHGCIRMHNNDLLDLFERVSAGCLVEIRET